MKDSLKPETISFAEFEANRKAYESFVSAKLHGLEDIRLHQIPELLEQRKTNGEAFLEKTEVSILMEWKLKHGTFRPNLAKLVASNSLQEVRQTTADAFETYSKDNANYTKAITALTKLKGIGPATASLILSSYDPVNIPFFSDELFRYLHWSEAKSKGWDQKINYTMKEYKDLYEQTQLLRQRLEKESGDVVRAIDLEKMAYALGKDARQKKDYGADDESDEALEAPFPKRRRKQSPEGSSDPGSSSPRMSPDGSLTSDGHGHKRRLTVQERRRGGGRLQRFQQRVLKRKAEIMGIEDYENKRSECWWDERVAMDLDILGDKLHPEIDVKDYKRWHRRGFRMKPGEFDKPSQEEIDDEMDKLRAELASRKESKRR